MAFHNEQTRQISAHLLGRGLYEDMLPWETAEETRSDPADLEFAAMWRSIPKVVFSTTFAAGPRPRHGWPATTLRARSPG